MIVQLSDDEVDDGVARFVLPPIPLPFSFLLFMSTLGRSVRIE